MCCTFVVGPCDLKTQTIHYPPLTNLVKLVFSYNVYNWTVLDRSVIFHPFLLAKTVLTFRYVC